MKCERFQAIAGELARNDIMDADERASALAHAAACEHCEEVLALQSRLSEGFRSLALETKAAQAPSGVEGKVLAAFRERTRVGSVPASSLRRHFRISAAAAVLLLAVGILGWRWYVASVPQPTEQASSQNAAGKVAPSKPEISPVVAVSPTQPPNASTPLGSRRFQSRKHSTMQAAKLNVTKRVATEPSLSATTHEIKEITTAFVPLGYGSALDLQDGGQMVRVELPRSALARFGLPMNMNRADEKIKADVLVGADGLARAIRFVQPTDQPTGELKPSTERNEK
jgi:hypothetical protein